MGRLRENCHDPQEQSCFRYDSRVSVRLRRALGKREVARGQSQRSKISVSACGQLCRVPRLLEASFAALPTHRILGRVSNAPYSLCAFGAPRGESSAVSRRRPPSLNVLQDDCLSY